jgi:hypothetical protein
MSDQRRIAREAAVDRNVFLFAPAAYLRQSSANNHHSKVPAWLCPPFSPLTWT